MARLFKNPVVFIVAYLALMLPTYILPYFGSNSLIINLMGAALTQGMTPQWWAHLWFLAMLAVVAHVRGKWVGKPYLLALPGVALVFDLTPVLSAIPLVPTLLHVLTLVLGTIATVVYKNDVDEGTSATSPSFKPAGWVTIVITLTSLAGMVHFYTGAKKAIPDKPIASQPPAKIPSTPKVAAEATKPAEAPSTSSAQPPASPSTNTTKAQKTKSTAAAQAAGSQTAKSSGASPAPIPKVRLININEP